MNEAQARKLLPFGQGWRLDPLDDDVAGHVRIQSPQGRTLYVDIRWPDTSRQRISRFVEGDLSETCDPICPTEFQQLEQRREELLNIARQVDPDIPCGARVVGGESLGGDLVVPMQIIVDGEPYQSSPESPDENLPPTKPTLGEELKDLAALLPPSWSYRIEPGSVGVVSLFNRGTYLQSVMDCDGPSALGLILRAAWKRYKEDAEAPRGMPLSQPPGEGISDNRTIISDCEEADGWTGDDTVGLDAFIQGDPCISRMSDTKIHGASGCFKKGDILECIGTNGVESVEVLEVSGSNWGTLTVRKCDSLQASGPLTFGDAPPKEAPPNEQSATVAGLPAGDRAGFTFSTTCPQCEGGWVNVLLFRKKCGKCKGTGRI